MHRSLIPFCHTGLSNCRATVQSFSLASCVALTPCRMECAINATCADRGTWPPPHQSCRQLPLVEPRRYGRQRRRRPATHAGSDEGALLTGPRPQRGRRPLQSRRRVLRDRGSLSGQQPLVSIWTLASKPHHQHARTHAHSRPDRASSEASRPLTRFWGQRLSPGPSLATEFQSFLNEHGVPELLRNRQPTHLLSPLACIAAQMDALQARRCAAPSRRLTGGSLPDCWRCRAQLRRQVHASTCAPLWLDAAVLRAAPCSGTIGRKWMQGCRPRLLLPSGRERTSC